jgi:exopolysaccharide biosynthesis protein
MTRILRTRVLVLGASVALLSAAMLAPTSTGAAAQTAARRSANRIAPGVTLVRVTQSRGPVTIYMLRIDPAKESTIDVGMPRHTIGGYARTSSIASAHNAMAAVNGDYSYSGGRPRHAFAEDGEIVQTGVRSAGDGFGASEDETRSFAGHPAINISAHVKNSNKDLEIDEWNSGDPGAGEINGFSELGGNLEAPPGGACSARLLKDGPLGWGQGGKVARDYVVDKVDCGAESMGLQGGIVLSADAGGTQAQNIRELNVRDSVRLTWTFGYPKVVDWIGGQPQIIANGRIVAPRNCGYICNRQPRTAVGSTANGTILMVVVDGRRPGYSVGMTLRQLARFMKGEGAVRAVNLDGGGSATMWVKGNVVNRPSDGGERSVTNALLLLPRGDQQQPRFGDLSRTTYAEPQPAPDVSVSDEEAAEAWALAQSDPGSTGGLLYALSKGKLEGTPRLEPSAQAVADAFARSVGR